MWVHTYFYYINALQFIEHTHLRWIYVIWYLYVMRIWYQFFFYVKNYMGGRMNDIQTRLTCCCFHLVIKRKIYKLYGYDANKDFSTVEAHIFYEIQTVSQMKWNENTNKRFRLVGWCCCWNYNLVPMHELFRKFDGFKWNLEIWKPWKDYNFVSSTHCGRVWRHEYDEH